MAEPCLRQTSSTDVKGIEACSEQFAFANLCGAHNDLSIITQGNLDQTLEGDIMTPWEPTKWHWVKTLAAAAAGEGSVELMTSRENPDQKVAVKRLPLGLIMSSPEAFDKQNPGASERPWTDICIVKYLNKLQLPCVCDLLGVFLAQDEQVFVMMSLASRGDLFSWVQTDTSEAGGPREIIMRPIVTQMFTGVQHLHNLGIAHRDLSAENVMLNDSGQNSLQVKIIDFGMATLSRMARREVRGKRSYQAPEMHCTAEYDTFLADIFSLGVITYCMGVHYYPWESTKPGKDRSTEFARAHGLEIFLKKKRLPCCKKPIAEVFSESYLELIGGLLNFDVQKRNSLGEACFQPISRKAFRSKSPWVSQLSPKSLGSKSPWVSERDTWSDVSTACSTLDILPSYSVEAEEDVLDPSQKDYTAHNSLSRISVWDLRWLLE